MTMASVQYYLRYSAVICHAWPFWTASSMSRSWPLWTASSMAHSKLTPDAENARMKLPRICHGEFALVVVVV